MVGWGETPLRSILSRSEADFRQLEYNGVVSNVTSLFFMEVLCAPLKGVL